MFLLRNKHVKLLWILGRFVYQNLAQFFESSLNSIMCVCSVCMHLCMWVYACKIGVFLAYPSPCLLRQNLSLNLDLTNSSRVAGQQASSNSAVCLASAGITATQPSTQLLLLYVSWKTWPQVSMLVWQAFTSWAISSGPKFHHLYWTNMVSRGVFRGGTLAAWPECPSPGLLGHWTLSYTLMFWSSGGQNVFIREERTTFSGGFTWWGMGESDSFVLFYVGGTRSL